MNPDALYDGIAKLRKDNRRRVLRTISMIAGISFLVALAIAGVAAAL